MASNEITADGEQAVFDHRRHVCIAGGGLAGLAAALSAAESGARVTIFEKEKSIGGNSAKATSGMNAVGTPAQAASGVYDSRSLFYADTMSSGHKLSDPILVRTLVAESADAVEWLRATGVSLDAVTLCGGHSAARTHHEAPRTDGKPTPVGWDIIAALRRAVEARADAITVRTATRVVELLQDTERWSPDRPRGRCPVVGVRIAATNGTSTAPERSPVATPPPTQDVACDAVILTTGGFANDHTATSLLAEFAPYLSLLPTTNGPFAQGDGVKLARAAGAALRGMEHVQVHPTGFVDPADPQNSTKFLAPEALRGVGGILLNHRGRRFTDELRRRDDVTAAMYRSCLVPGAELSAAEREVQDAHPAPVVAYMVLTPAAAARFGPNFNFYFRAKRFFREVEGAAGVAREIGTSTSVEEVGKTFQEYAEAARRGQDKFGTTAFIDSFEGAAESRLYIARVTPSIHYTMGGAAIDTSGRVLYGGKPRPEGGFDADGVIPGLWAAGEASGGVHGGNRLAGNSLLECVVFGRRAGRSAAGIELATPSELNEDSSATIV